MKLFPALYQTLDTPDVRALIGDPLRLFSFGDAGDGPVAKPYVLWQTVGGEPENYLGDRPEVDRFSVQIDVYATDGKKAREVVAAIVPLIETRAYVVSWNGEFRDYETKLYRVSFDVDWFVHR